VIRSTRVTAVIVAAAAVAVTLDACSTAHHARPLGAGKQAVHLSIGGPVAGVGEPSLLLPLPTLTYKYGVTDRLDVFGGWHILETFINGGNFFFDVGTSYYILDQDGFIPGVSAALTMSPLLNAHSGWVAFDLQGTASWFVDPSNTQLVYVGFHNIVTPVRDQVLSNPGYTWTPYIGWQGRLLPWLGLGLEIDWHRPYENTTRSVAAYVAPGDQGALAFLLGVTFYASELGGDP